MNQILELLKKSMTIYLSDNEYASMIIPEKQENKIVYKFFSYLAYENENVVTIFNIPAIFEYNEEKQQMNKNSLKSLENLIEIKGNKPTTYKEWKEKKEKYYNKLNEILSILYIEKITQEERKKILEFKNVFDEIIVEDMKKIYKTYFPNFMNWIENI